MKPYNYFILCCLAVTDLVCITQMQPVERTLEWEFYERVIAVYAGILGFYSGFLKSVMPNYIKNENTQTWGAILFVFVKFLFIIFDLFQ